MDLGGLTIGNRLAGSGTFFVSGPGAVFGNGLNAMSGFITIQAGADLTAASLAVLGNGNVANPASLQIDRDGRLVLNLAANGNLNPNDPNQRLGNSLNGDGLLVRRGLGNLVINQANAAFVGSVRLEGGRTLLAVQDALGTSKITLAGGGLVVGDISLADFAKIVDVLDEAGASFVSVTQAFNTTNSMGRLTLNVLLSFAQFEREVVAERIRDKVAASKARGMWMGGSLPLGYTAINKKLVPVPDEAATVVTIMELYLKSANVLDLAETLRRQGIVSKQRMGRNGERKGGVPFTRGALHHLLSNRTYVGEVVHRGKIYPGEHEAIVNRALFDAVHRGTVRQRAREVGVVGQEFVAACLEHKVAIAHNQAIQRVDVA